MTSPRNLKFHDTEQAAGACQLGINYQAVNSSTAI